MKKGLQESANSPMNEIAKPGILVATLAKKILEAVSANEHVFSCYSEQLCTGLFTILGNPLTILKNSSSMLTRFYNYRIGKKQKEHWMRLLSDLEVDASEDTALFLFNCIMDCFLKECIASHKPDAELTIPARSLTRNEEETLYYVSGYLIFSLKKNLPNNSNKKLMLQLLDSWGSKSDDDLDNLTLADYTKSWVSQVNRGGLYQVSSDFYGFVVAIEKSARTVLNLNLLVTYCGESVRSTLKTKLENNRSILHLWKELCVQVTNEKIKDKLFDLILGKWINVRANAFIKVWMQQFKWAASKKGEHVSEQGEPSLRKTLAKKRKVDRSMISPKKKPCTPQKTSNQQAAASKLKRAKYTLRAKKRL